MTRPVSPDQPVWTDYSEKLELKGYIGYRKPKKTNKKILTFSVGTKTNETNDLNCRGVRTLFLSFPNENLSNNHTESNDASCRKRN